MRYNAPNVISDYLKPLCKNKYTIKDILLFADMIKCLPSLLNDEEYVSFDTMSLFTNISLGETIHYIIERICPQDIEILCLCPARSVLPYGEKKPL